jgi:hypothetical protein
MIPETSSDSIRNDLLRLIGPVRRARGYRLYTTSGRRILDLWQDGGRAILGHRGGSSLTVLKNTIERGPGSPLPSVFENRLKSALKRLMQQDHVFRVFSNYERALIGVSQWIGREITAADALDPVRIAEGSAEERGPLRLWRPFLPAGHSPFENGSGRFAVFPVLPCSGDSPPQVVLFSDSQDEAPTLPDSDIVAAYRLAALVRGIHDLVSAQAPPEVRVPRYQSVGPYLFQVDGGRAYAERFEILLKNGFLTSPSPSAPSIVPAEMSSGELVQLRRAAAIAVQSETGNGD